MSSEMDERKCSKQAKTCQAPFLCTIFLIFFQWHKLAFHLAQRNGTVVKIRLEFFETKNAFYAENCQTANCASHTSTDDGDKNAQLDTATFNFSCGSSRIGTKLHYSQWTTKEYLKIHRKDRVNSARHHGNESTTK